MVKSSHVTFLVALVFSGLSLVDIRSQSPSDAGVARAQSGLQVLYDFSGTAVEAVEDRSAATPPIRLRVTNPKAVERNGGSLVIKGVTRLQSDRSVGRVVDSIRRSGELTLEAWITPANTEQSGPARIFSISNGSSQRNITLGQEGDKYDIRLRTTQTGVNGLPSLTLKPGSARSELTHIVYTRDRSGLTRVFLNGDQVVEKNIGGSTEGWERFRITLADEFGGKRLWKGTYHLIAIYSRDLLPGEVKAHYEVGPDFTVSDATLAKSKRSRGAELFEDHIAPMFAKHCLECHDSATAKGKLDLSKKSTLFAGGSGGEVIVPGKAAESYLFESVESNEMPEDRTPLSSREKELLKEWINEGAEWTLGQIDPVVYEHEGAAEENWLRRLTVDEYVETVRSAVGVDIQREAGEILPKDLRADGFSNTAYNLNVDMGHVSAYAQLASIIVERMNIPEFSRRFERKLKFTDKDMGRLIKKMGKWLLRGPVDDGEIILYRGISTSVASAGGSLNDAVGYIVEAMLQSPRFIYRLENQRGDGSFWPVGQYELASRLSYSLWGGPPDEELMRAADENELFDRPLLEGQIDRMLKDPRAVGQSIRFISEWLNLNRLANLRPASEKYPKWDPALAADMRQETELFFREIVWNQKRPLSDLMNAQITFATGRLAEHYGIPVKGDELQRYDLSQVSSRGGLMTQGSVLTVGGDDASMVTRGLFMLHDVLRGTVKDPPPGLDTTPVPSSPGKSNRFISQVRIDSTSCGGCHGKFEPMAFAFEKYDGLGSFRERDEFSNLLREDGAILIPGEAKAKPFATAAELMDLLAASDRVKETITWKVTQWVLGRPLEARDVPAIDSIHEASQKNGGTYADLMKAILTSDLVCKTKTEFTDSSSNG